MKRAWRGPGGNGLAGLFMHDGCLQMGFATIDVMCCDVDGNTVIVVVVVIMAITVMITAMVRVMVVVMVMTGTGAMKTKRMMTIGRGQLPWW